MVNTVCQVYLISLFPFLNQEDNNVLIIAVISKHALVYNSAIITMYNFIDR